MIERREMFVPLLEAHPELSVIWDPFVGEWKWHQDELPSYIFMPDLVQECSRMLARGQKYHVSKILQVVERWIVEGDAYVSEVATAGFIEDLQNGNHHEGTAPEDFLPLLGPASKYWWKKVDLRRSKGEPLVDDR